jgi:hypothetical protein
MKSCAVQSQETTLSVRIEVNGASIPDTRPLSGFKESERVLKMSYNEEQYDSEAEEAIDWYQHWKSISIEGLAMEYTLREQSDREVPVSLRMAVEAREEEMSEALLGGSNDN